jgi:hypothetical protein
MTSATHETKHDGFRFVCRRDGAWRVKAIGGSAQRAGKGGSPCTVARPHDQTVAIAELRSAAGVVAGGARTVAEPRQHEAQLIKRSLLHSDAPYHQEEKT